MPNDYETRSKLSTLIRTYLILTEFWLFLKTFAERIFQYSTSRYVDTSNSNFKSKLLFVIPSLRRIGNRSYIPVGWGNGEGQQMGGGQTFCVVREFQKLPF